MGENTTKETRVTLYSNLRDKIDRMDTLSFDDPNRDEKYGLNNKNPSMPIIHEESMTHSELKEQHIKKNTLSISIDELIKQNDDYTMLLEKKELDKSFKNIKKKNITPDQKKKRLFIILGAISFVIVVIVIVLLILLLGGKK